MRKINLFFEVIYEGLKKYKDDKLFLMEVPNAEEMIRTLEDDDETLFEKDFFGEFSEEYYYLSVFIHLFEENKEDIKWYYENRKFTLNEKIRYEFVNNDEDYNDIEMDEMLDIYNRCISGYGQAYYYLYHEDWLFILTKEEGENKQCPVRFALEILNSWIKSGYYDYEKNCRKDRDIFAEINQTINDLKKYSKDEIFLKEVPQVFDIMDNLKIAINIKDEDRAYDEFWKISFIRDSLNLYKENPADKKFFYENRDISRLIKVDKVKSNGYINKLWDYIRIFEKSQTFADCWISITCTINIVRDEYLSKDITLEYNKDSIEEYMKWV